jgi:hypothetical protein
VTQDSGDGLADTTGRWRPTATEVVAHECAKAGAEQLNRSVLANLESGRRKFVTLDEVIALAYVLDVAPVHLLVPTSEVVDHRKFGRVLVDGYRLTDKLSADSLQRARAWIKGEAALPGVDRRMYDAERPEGDPRDRVPAGAQRPDGRGLRWATSATAGATRPAPGATRTAGTR